MDASFLAIVQLLISNIYVIFTIFQMENKNSKVHIEMWILSGIAFIIPCAVSIYGIFFISTEDSKRGGLSILLSFLYLSFLICVNIAKIITICYESDDVSNGIWKLLNYNDQLIWIIFIVWATSTLLFVVNVILENCDKIQRQIHESFILCILNYITYFILFFFGFFVFNMCPSPKGATPEIKSDYTTINTFCGGMGVFMNFCILKQILFKKVSKEKDE